MPQLVDHGSVEVKKSHQELELLSCRDLLVKRYPLWLRIRPFEDLIDIDALRNWFAKEVFKVLADLLHAGKQLLEFIHVHVLLSEDDLDDLVKPFVD